MSRLLRQQLLFKHKLSVRYVASVWMLRTEHELIFNEVHADVLNSDHICSLCTN